MCGIAGAGSDKPTGSGPTEVRRVQRTRADSLREQRLAGLVSPSEQEVLRQQREIMTSTWLDNLHMQREDAMGGL